MATLNPDLCVACLNSGRKMVYASDHNRKLCFYQLLPPLSNTYKDDADIPVCWECHARLGAITRFKVQVQRCHHLLQEYLKSKKVKNLNPVMNLKLSVLPSLDLPDNDESDVKFEVLTVKEESVDGDGDGVLTDDDDELLIEVSRKQKEKKKKKKIKTEPTTDLENLEIYRIVELSKDEVVRERSLQAAQELYINAMFKCERCIITFPNSDDLKDHEDSKHNVQSTSKHVCPVCTCTFASDMSLNYHRHRHTRRYQCVQCDDNFVNKRAVTKHYEMEHTFGINQYENRKNGLTKDKVHSDQENVNDSNRDEAMFSCESCDKKFRWKTSLRKHNETHRIETGQKRKPYCEPCRVSFTTTANLQKHVRTSSKHQIQLKIRQMKDTAESSIEAIKSTVNAESARFSCELCGARFQWRGNLLRHQHSHAAKANGELVCQPCNRTFSSIATFKQHMKISKRHVTENEFKYMCSDCGKRFANKTRLKDHVDWEHLKRYAHVCTRCDKVFKTSASLYLHRQAAHRQAGSGRLCHHCGKALPNLGKLRSHISAAHAGLSPHACAECGARFAWRSCLARHLRRAHQTRNT